MSAILREVAIVGLGKKECSTVLRTTKVISITPRGGVSRYEGGPDERGAHERVFEDRSNCYRKRALRVTTQGHNLSYVVYAGTDQTYKEVDVGKVSRSATTPTISHQMTGHVVRLLTPGRPSIPPSSRPPPIRTVR